MVEREKREKEERRFACDRIDLLEVVGLFRRKKPRKLKRIDPEKKKKTKKKTHRSSVCFFLAGEERQD